MGISILLNYRSLILFFFFFQASPAPIIVNTDTLDTIPYVSIKGFFNKYVVLVYFHTEILFGIA